jgi:hypothetical protein
LKSIRKESTIRPISKSSFRKIVSSYGEKKYVSYPWTIKESVYADKAYTGNVYDCTVCGITDGAKVLMLHICPTIPENNNFEEIKAFIKRNIDLGNKKLKAFLFGSKNIKALGAQSSINFKKFEKMLANMNIPYSKIKGGPCVNDVAYSSQTDEWLISFGMLEGTYIKNDFNSPEEFIRRYYDEVELNEFDKFSW